MGEENFLKKALALLSLFILAKRGVMFLRFTVQYKCFFIHCVNCGLML